MVRGVAALVVVTMAAGLLVILPATPSGASVVTERPVYGRNEAVYIQVGQIFYTSPCEEGVRDWIYPVADIYVVKGSTPPSGALSDVSGTPNTVFGVTGGGIFGELIGYTAPAGGLGPGTYSVVIDECQDGNFNASEDTFVPDAFRVVSDVVGQPLPNIGALKSQAQGIADQYETAVKWWNALLKLSTAADGAAGTAYGFMFKIAQGLGAPNPAGIATIAFGNKGKHFAGIAADPPDPAYDQPTVLAPTAVPAVLDAADPIDSAAADVVAQLTTSAALTEGLLQSMERYQGAWSARDGEWQLAHAREVQAYAQLLADQGAADELALDALADDLDALPTDFDADLATRLADIDSFLTSGPTSEELADLANQGTSTSEMTVILSELRDELDGFVFADLLAALRGAADEAAIIDNLETLADDMQPVIDGLVADPFVEGTVPVVDAGGPYTASVGGAALALDGSATTGPEPLAFAWDLDGDGDFDDATGATPSTSPAAGFEGLAALQVTGAGGDVSVGYAPLSITGGPAGPTLTAPDPAGREVTVAAGATQTFSVAAAGDSPTTTWHLDGVEVGSGSAFGFTPSLADAGPHILEAEVTDVSGQRRVHQWFVSVTAPDSDGDDWWVTVDCDDTVDTTYPGAPELLDGVDNDCDPSTPDGGVAPVVDAGAALVGSEGATLDLAGSFTHPSGTYTATVDWGDGVVEAVAVTGTTVEASHVYTDDGLFAVQLCVTAALGKTACDTTTATVSNEPAGPRLGTLENWTVEEFSGGAGNWEVAPDGLSVFQSKNGDPTFFMADADLPQGVEAGVTIAAETAIDDDYIGFALGLQPGFITDDSADYLILDWKQGTQSSTGCLGDTVAEEGLSLIRVGGVPHTSELWSHNDCPAPREGSVDEIARADTLGDAGWDNNTQYRFRIRYDESSLKIWVDDVLEFDVVGDFPQGRLGFYNYSQQNVRYSGYQLVPGNTVEGTERPFEVTFEDPGISDTHTATISWGDGTPDDLLLIEETDGAGTGTKVHRYVEDGTYEGEVCVTDDDGDTACQQFPIDVANAPPTVEAGRDRVSARDLTLDDSVFNDPGVEDTHTATVDWGDGSAVEVGGVSELLGEGIVSAAHTYASDGLYDIEVCVTDDDGDTGCDTFEADIRFDNRAPVAISDPDRQITEGDDVVWSLGFTDENPDDTHTATIDWGDGSPVVDVDVVESGAVGGGGASHTYRDDGVFTVTLEVCDDGGACDDATAAVTVLNATPVVSAEGGVAGGGPQFTEEMEVTATFTDAGPDDTHTATIDWDDGAGPEAVPVVQASGGGSLVANRSYAVPGSYDVEVCVIDDDGAADCDNVTLEAVGALPGPPLDVSAIGGDANARVRWEPPLDIGGSALVSYEIETSPGGSVVTVPATELAVVIVGLSNDTDYTFRVRASNAFGFGPWSEPSNLTRPRPPCAGAVFPDVGPAHPFCPEIKWMADNGVANGFPDGHYKPEQAISRQGMAGFSYRLLNPDDDPAPCLVKPFADVALTNPFCGEIAWMKAEGISQGFPDGTYRSLAPVSRQAMTAFMYRLTGSPRSEDPACVTDEFPDVPASHAFCGEIDWIVDVGVTGGFADGTFRPSDPVARQAMAAFIFRYNILTGFIT